MFNIISVDGGGTKTKGVIYSHTGEVLEEVIVGFSNATVNYKETLNNIKKCLDYLLEKNYKIDLLVLGISGSKEKIIKEKLKSDLENLYKEKLILITDLEMAYYSYFIKQKGILGIIGTGSSFITIENSELKSAGGWGHILQDYGSGYKLSIEVIKKAIEEYEMGNYELSEKIKSFYQINDFSNIKNIVYLEDKREVAKLSKSLFEWLKEENTSDKLKEIIKNIIDREVLNVTNQIYNFYKLNFTQNENIDILLTGGLVINNHMYFDKIKNKLEKKSSFKMNIKKLKSDPVYGGYNLAKSYLKGM